MKKIGEIRPFYSMCGQFEEGKYTLIVGLSVEALKANKKYRIFLGKNREKIYEVNCNDALNFAYHRQSFWTADNGCLVAILPVHLFTARRNHPEKPEKMKKSLTERERFYKNYCGL
jgi:hypothetical protein